MDNHLQGLRDLVSPDAFPYEEEKWVPADLYELAHMSKLEMAPGFPDEALNALLRAVYRGSRKREQRRFQELKSRHEDVIQDLKRQFDHAGE